jgi:hypothetical protein
MKCPISRGTFYLLAILCFKLFHGFALVLQQ